MAVDTSLRTSHASAATTTAKTSRKSEANTTADSLAGSVPEAPVPSRASVAAAAGRSGHPAASSTTSTSSTAAAGAATGLQNFKLTDLNQFLAPGSQPIPPNATSVVFNVGSDNVHGVLEYLLSRTNKSLDMNMFGYDDPDLNTQVMRCATNPKIATNVTLDESQAAGAHEKQILQADEAQNPQAFAQHFAIGQSPTHQIAHTKGGVLDGVVGFEGSVNWSTSGEGTFVNGSNQAGGAGYKAQNNTLTVFVDPYNIQRLTAALATQHASAVAQGKTLNNLSASAGA